MDREQVLEILRILEQEYPQAGTLLRYSNTFELLVAVILSAQSTDEQVNRVTPALFDKFPTPESMAQADLRELEEAVRAVGLYRSKAANLRKMAQALVDQYEGTVPGEFEELLKLPGVGRKSANVVLAVGFDKPGLGVDTHVQRVANRLGLARTKQPEQTEHVLKQLIPEHKWSRAHHLFIFHGRRVCKARYPDCENCVLVFLCEKNLD